MIYQQIGKIGIVLSCGLVAPVTAAAAETLRLENTHIAVDIDADNGGIRSIRDKQRELTYQVPGIGFAITTDAGTVRSEKVRSIKHSGGEAELEFAAGGLEVGLHFRLRPDDRFIEKWLVIQSAGRKPYFLKEVVMEDVTAAASFATIHFHDDQSNWHCPINFFLRGDKGGCFAGLEYPWWDYELRGNTGFRLGYKPNYPVTAGEVNTSETCFLGVYRKEGVSRESHGPTPLAPDLRAVLWLSGRGQPQKANSCHSFRKRFFVPILDTVADSAIPSPSRKPLDRQKTGKHKTQGKISPNGAWPRVVRPKPSRSVGVSPTRFG